MMPHIPQDPAPVPCHSRVELCARYPDSAPPSGATQAPRDIMSLCREVHSRRDSLRWESVGHGVTGTGPGCSPHPPPPQGQTALPWPGLGDPGQEPASPLPGRPLFPYTRDHLVVCLGLQQHGLPHSAGGNTSHHPQCRSRGFCPGVFRDISPSGQQEGRVPPPPSQNRQ